MKKFSVAPVIVAVAVGVAVDAAVAVGVADAVDVLLSQPSAFVLGILKAHKLKSMLWNFVRVQVNW